MYKARVGFIAYLFFTLASLFSMAQQGDRIAERKESESKKNSGKKEIKSAIGLWQIDGYGAFKDSTLLDTLHDFSHVFHPVYKKVITASYLGNYGNPALDNNFFNRNYSTRFFFAHSREWYFLTPDKLDFYNTTTPYTRFDYSQSENKSKNNETRLNIIHSQNINPHWNFTFRTRHEKSDGQYNAQKSRNNFVALYTSYNKDNFNVYGGAISNLVEGGENGGINDSLLFEKREPEFWATKLVSSKTKLGNTIYFANGEYRIGKWIEGDGDTETFVPIVGVFYSFHYERNRMQFKEEEDKNNTYFKDTYFGNYYSKDSVRFNSLENVVQLKQYENPKRRFSFGKRAFLGYELSKVSIPNKAIEVSAQKDYPSWLLGEMLRDDWSEDNLIISRDSSVIRQEVKYSNLFVGGGIFRETGNFWTWNFDGKLYLAGRNAGQLELNGNISKPFVFLGDSTASIRFTGKIENNVPDYFQENYKSKHIKWSNNLEMEQRMTAGASFHSPQRKLDIGANYSIVNNLFYNDKSGIPNQTGKEILVLSAYFDKDFQYRNIHFRTRVLWQKASDEEFIHLPDLSTFISTYYQFTISKVLFTQLGADLRYNTKYYADAYNPATGLFYLQNETKYGNYPYIDIYANVRLKRTRVFFKFQNIGTFRDIIKGIYMTTPHYPMNRFTFRLGVSWAFYD